MRFSGQPRRKQQKSRANLYYFNEKNIEYEIPT